MSVPAGTVASALPKAAQAQLARYQADATPPASPAATDPPTPPAVATTPPAPPAADPPTPPATTPPNGERVTLSREEYNALKLGSEAKATAEGRAAARELELEEARHRLTELENASKATPSAPATPPASTPQVTFTAEEEEEFKDSRSFIERVAQMVFHTELAKVMPAFEQQLKQLKESTDSVATRMMQSNQRTFLQQLHGRVPKQPELIKHKLWPDFVDAKDAISGVTYGQLLAHHVKQENLESVAAIYEKFEKEYVSPAATNTGDPAAAYSGAAPTGGATPVSGQQPTVTKLKFSDRNKASLDYRHGRITFEQLQQVNDAFAAADKLGNVDYKA